MEISQQEIAPGRYQLVPRTLIFITYKDQILLLKGSPGKRLWAGLYNGLGGHIERGEDVISAGRRELFEETGLGDISLRICGVITVDTGRESGICIFVLHGEADQINVKSSPEGSPEWITMDRIGTLPLVEDLPVLLPRLLAMRPGDPPFSAHYHALSGERLKIMFSDESQFP